MWCALSPRCLFFKGAPALLPMLTVESHSWTWWILVVGGVWALGVIVFLILWSRFLARWVFGPRKEDDDE